MKNDFGLFLIWHKTGYSAACLPCHESQEFNTVRVCNSYNYGLISLCKFIVNYTLHKKHMPLVHWGSETELHCLGLCPDEPWVCQVAVASKSFTGKQALTSWYCAIPATSVIDWLINVKCCIGSSDC